MDYDFTWRDGERTIRFARGAILEAPRLIGEGFTLVTTARAREQHPNLELGAEQVIEVGPGFVDEIAGDILANGTLSTRIVALGGGRVIDTAKALGAAASQPTLVAAIPTTLSAAEMTWGHRQARGAPAGSGTMRPQLVITDPTVLLAEGLPEEGEPLLDPLALGALLSGYAIDANWYGIHHVVSQTLVRNAGVSHGDANAAMLPITSAALRERRIEEIAAIDAATGVPVEELARRFARRAQAESLQAIGVDEAILPQLAEIASQRSELALTPPPAGAEELLELYRAAW